MFIMSAIITTAAANIMTIYFRFVPTCNNASFLVVGGLVAKVITIQGCKN